jgi:hypothetical protein
MAEVFSQEWREEHAREGDRLLAILEGWDADASASAALIAVATTAAVAQAHYAAANVRARPAGPVELRTRTPYAIPGVAGVWEIRGMKTADMGEGEPTEIQLFRVDR